MEGRDPRDQEDLRDRKVSVTSTTETFIDLCQPVVLAIIILAMHRSLQIMLA